jgi:peptidoglycan hydrolase CwlO-like protein
VQFLSIKDAALRYQKAEITIRRFVRSVIEKERAKERTFVHPLPQEVVRLRKQRRPFSYTISSELLERHYGPVTDSALQKNHAQAQGYLALLEQTNAAFAEQLKVKDDQIRSLSQAIDGLSERQRETNILMKGLQERLLLPAAPGMSAKKSWWKMW